jgi:hypothetical protein
MFTRRTVLAGVYTTLDEVDIFIDAMKRALSSRV